MGDFNEDNPPDKWLEPTIYYGSIIVVLSYIVIPIIMYFVNGA